MRVTVVGKVVAVAKDLTKPRDGSKGTEFHAVSLLQTTNRDGKAGAEIAVVKFWNGAFKPDVYKAGADVTIPDVSVSAFGGGNGRSPEVQFSVFGN